MPSKGNAPMPACNLRDQQKIIDAIETLRGDARNRAEDLLEEIGPKALCSVLHGMRRWYTSQAWTAASRVLEHREALNNHAMDLSPPVGAYRGFKVPEDSPIAQLSEGDVGVLPQVTRNGACSSWTLGRELADRFSGASPGKVGMVVKLAKGHGVAAFIAPPEASEVWWNTLYERTMGRSFRFKEREYAIYAPKLVVEIVRVKRR